MKKLLIVAIAAVAFTSCSKEYTCECVTPATDATNQMNYKTTRKSHAQTLCTDWESRQRSAVAGQQSNVECTIK